MYVFILIRKFFLRLYQNSPCSHPDPPWQRGAGRENGLQKAGAATMKYWRGRQSALALARTFPVGIWSSKCSQEPSQAGPCGNWKIWPKNKPFFSQSPFFWNGHWAKSGGSNERNLRNRIEAIPLVQNNFGTRRRWWPYVLEVRRRLQSNGEPSCWLAECPPMDPAV